MSSKQFEYTTLAHRYTARFPFLTYLGIQINFWIVANILLVTILNLQSQIHSLIFNIDTTVSIKSVLLLAITFGVLYGLVYGLMGYYLERKLFRKLSLGKVILFKTMVSIALLFLILWLFRLVLFDLFIASSLNVNHFLDDEIWGHIFYLLLIYYFFMALLISFINQVNKKYGPGVLVPLLFGRYRHPREEERIFLFMDLKSSTTTAEKLGHLQYSSFIRDCFEDINEILFPFRAQVYQYVGDEIVVMWPEKEGLKDNYCVRFFYACKKRFHEKEEYYLKNYDFTPEFKAGLHSGKVTAVEIGEIKKDIAYHGDTLNTAARIQSICNQYNKNFLVSEYLLSKLELNPFIKTEILGKVSLRGKSDKIGIVSLDWIDGK